MKNKVLTFAQLLEERHEPEMVHGIAQILRQVRDRENRLEIAEQQLASFEKEGIIHDRTQFFRQCGLI